MLLATVSTTQAAPVIVGQRLRKGSCGSPRGAQRLVADALKTVRSLRPDGAAGPVLLRADSAFCGSPTVGAAVRAGAQVSVTVRMDPKVKAAIATIGQDAWTAIEYTDAVFDEDSGQWISRAEVGEVPFTAFSSRKSAEQVVGRLVVRRIPDFNAPANPDQATLFQLWRFHAFFTTSTLTTVEADKTHRAHAIIEQVHADLKSSAIAHLPSAPSPPTAPGWSAPSWRSTSPAPPAPWPAAAVPSDHRYRPPHPDRRPGPVASSARRLTLHLPQNWPWEQHWTELFTRTCRPPPPAAT